MTTSGKISHIGQLYQQVRSHAVAGRPGSADQMPNPVTPVDRVTLSKEALSRCKEGTNNPSAIKGEQDLSTEEKQAVNNLKRRDAEVKAHEASHMASGGGVVQGGATYEYQSGPDGKMYAVGGEVQIDTSPAGSPDATIRKMQQIRRAALAPAQPSGTDRAVAAQAAQIEAQARMEKLQEVKEYADAATPDAAQPRPTGQQKDRSAAKSIGSQINQLA
jgi:hypothetical protein